MAAWQIDAGTLNCDRTQVTHVPRVRGCMSALDGGIGWEGCIVVHAIQHLLSHTIWCYITIWPSLIFTIFIHSTWDDQGRPHKSMWLLDSQSLLFFWTVVFLTSMFIRNIVEVIAALWTYDYWVCKYANLASIKNNMWFSCSTWHLVPKVTNYDFNKKIDSLEHILCTLSRVMKFLVRQN